MFTPSGKNYTAMSIATSYVRISLLQRFEKGTVKPYKNIFGQKISMKINFNILQLIE